MKKILFYLISVAMIGYTSCSKEKKEPLLPYGLPGTSIIDMAIDNNHVFYFVTTEIDKEALKNWPSYLSYLPYKCYLSRKTKINGNIEILDVSFNAGRKMCFDKNNHFLTYDANTIYRIDGSLRHAIFELPDKESELSFIAVDNDNNIWAGSYQTGLYKIDNQLDVTHYHVNNSKLPTNNLSDIYIDKNNDIWIVTQLTWNRQGLIKISNEQWIVYDLDLKNPRITSLVTDKNGYLWIGTGWDDEDQSLNCFNGTSWEIVYPRNEKNEIVEGTVSYLQSDGHKLYVLVAKAKVKDNKIDISYTNDLLTFDGKNWEKVYEIPEGDWIGNLIVDDYRQVVWVRTYYDIFKIPFHLNK